MHRAERATGEFQRVVGLPKDVDVDGIVANYDRGVLEITLPKVAKPQPRKIPVSTGI